MRRALFRILAVLTVALLLVGILPGRHLCAMAAQAEDHPEEAHDCCKKLQADSATAPSPTAAPDPFCAGSCCDSVGQAGLSVAPDLAVHDAGIALAAPMAAAPRAWPAGPGRDVAARGPRGPPPRTPTQPLFLRNRVLLR